MLAWSVSTPLHKHFELLSFDGENKHNPDQHQEAADATDDRQQTQQILLYYKLCVRDVGLLSGVDLTDEGALELPLHLDQLQSEGLDILRDMGLPLAQHVHQRLLLNHSDGENLVPLSK